MLLFHWDSMVTLVILPYRGKKVGGESGQTLMEARYVSPGNRDFIWVISVCPRVLMTPQKIPPPATLSGRNLDLNTVTIPFPAHSVTVGCRHRNHCRVSRRGHNPYALTNLATTLRRAPHYLHQPPAYRLSALSAHILAKSLLRRRPPHRRTTTITHTPQGFGNLPVIATLACVEPE